MKTHSLRSVLLAVLAFSGAFQFRNSRKIQENITKNKSKHSLSTKDCSGAENERTLNRTLCLDTLLQPVNVFEEQDTRQSDIQVHFSIIPLRKFDICVQISIYVRRSGKSRSRTRYSISSADFREKQRDRNIISDRRAVPG